MKLTSSQLKTSGCCFALALAFSMAGCGGSGSSTSTSTSNVSVTLNQTSANVAVSATTQFTATVTNTSNTAVTWAVDSISKGNATVGTISASGLYTAPAQPGSHTVSATSEADSSATASAKVAVGTLTVSPATVTVVPGATEQFSVTVQGFTNTSVTWSVDKIAGGNSTVGTISSSGLYTAPAQPGSHTVTATSAADGSDVASASISVAAIAVSITPASALVGPSQTEQFTASVSGGSTPTFTWSVDQIAGGNATVGTISAGGLYTAPTTTGPHTITATSSTNSAESASASIGVATVAVSPATATLIPSQNEFFTANVQGTTSTAVTWSVDGIVGGNATVGAISQNGVYMAPSGVGTHTISAAISANTALNSSAAATVFAFSVSPNPSTIAPSATQQFTASIQGISNTAVTWSVDGVAGGNSTTGTISTAGLYTAPSTIGFHTISAVSPADPVTSVSASLTVINVAQAAVLTFHNDDARDGAYTQEVQLTPTKVNSTTFGKLLSYPVDGGILGQPLYVPQLSIGGGTYDVVFVVTQNNSVYAFNADATSSGTAQTFWHVNLNVNNLVQGLGIGSTPVIDVTTNTMYVLAETTQQGSPATPFHLYALNILTGAEQFNNSPVLVTATVTGSGLDSSNNSITLETSCTDRMGLALNPVTNAIYIGFGDCNHGWILAYDKSTLFQIATFNDTPDGGGGGLWSSGGSFAIDDTTGDLYLLTGVDEKDDTLLSTGYNDSFLRLEANDLAVLDSFTPDNYQTLADNDADLGSGGNIIVPGSPTVPNVTVGGGKDGNVYVVNRSDMGGLDSTTILQTVPICNDQWDNIFDTPVYWNGSLYFHCNNNVIQAFSWNASTTQMSTTPTSVGTAVFQTHGATPSLSANGNTNGIVWDIDNTASGSGPAVLHAYDATNVATELYNSSQAANGRDTAGTALKFNTPTIANGKVFVPTATELDVYGVLP